MVVVKNENKVELRILRNSFILCKFTVYHVGNSINHTNVEKIYLCKAISVTDYWLAKL